MSILPYEGKCLNWLVNLDLVLLLAAAPCYPVWFGVACRICVTSNSRGCHGQTPTSPRLVGVCIITSNKEDSCRRFCDVLG
jgi:hypothetical protein